MRFYLVAMAFIVLDVEIVFLYPFITVMKGLGPYGLIAMGVFMLVLIVPFAYLLSSGALGVGSGQAGGHADDRALRRPHPVRVGRARPRRPRPLGPARRREPDGVGEEAA